MAVQCGGEMRRTGLGVFAGCGSAVMAGLAAIHDTAMIKHCSGEAAGGVTGAAILACRQMGVCLAAGECTIMAGTAVIHDTDMIKDSRDKAGAQVAGAAVAAGRYMVWRRRFAMCDDAIMAGGTVIHDTGMIESGTRKGNGVMA